MPICQGKQTLPEPRPGDGTPGTERGQRPAEPAKVFLRAVPPKGAASPPARGEEPRAPGKAGLRRLGAQRPSADGENRGPCAPGAGSCGQQGPSQTLGGRRIPAGGDRCSAQGPVLCSGPRADALTAEPNRPGLRSALYLEGKKAWCPRPGVLGLNFTACCHTWSLFRGSKIELPTFTLPNTDPPKNVLDTPLSPSFPERGDAPIQIHQGSRYIDQICADGNAHTTFLPHPRLGAAGGQSAWVMPEPDRVPGPW